ncbi:hypothetical protein N7447_004174 [Penicillium robsamsonii]|uniref:uncharacterized protein n=1 Tax=Penicillium robsamsonii TaxID=1792511 RepID=UPI002548703F|nr:uncharacterized protein N7447_004174 [Penicillium robsamsonii]KAJ5827411.1 hypothetical protein N7447_004174 [Penicillium robsamsonii]
MNQLRSVSRSPPPTPSKSTLPARSPAKSTTRVPLVLPVRNFWGPISSSRVAYKCHFEKFIVPPGWTARPGSPSFEYEWDSVNSAGQKIARSYVLTPGRPILDDDDVSLTTFQSGDKPYIWDVLCYDVYEIAPQDINEVARILSQKGVSRSYRNDLDIAV